MTQLPDSETLTGLVSQVTETMFDMTCVMAETIDTPAPDNDDWRLVILPLTGLHDVTVAVACDGESSELLGSAMFGLSLEEVDEEMAYDSLSELANIIAGQIKSLLGGECILGLPRRARFGEAEVGSSWRSATLVSPLTGVAVWVAISEPGAEAAA